MESLPDELQLLIFRYLHKLDIFNAFYNLNERFQRIIQPYLYDIDLTHASISYKQFSLFLKQIAFSQELPVRFLKIDVEHHVPLLHPLIHQLTGLQSLTIADYFPTHEHHPFLVDALSLLTLSKISIHLDGSPILKIIAASRSQNLTTLILHEKFGVSASDFCDVSQMPYVKCLSINISRPTVLVKVFETMPNISELNLSITHGYDMADVNLRELPITLEKLQIEIQYNRWHGGSFEIINYLLDLFKNQIQQLALIIREAPEEFSNFDKFQSLTRNFTRLQIFDYNILTIHPPDYRLSNVTQLPNSRYYLISTPGKPEPFLIELKQTNVSLNIDRYSTLEQLFNCTSISISTNKLSQRLPTAFQSIEDHYMFENLKQIELDCMVKGKEKTHHYSILANIVARSPNLDTIFVQSGDMATIVLYLENLVSGKDSKKIKHLVLRECTTHNDRDSSSSSSSSSSDYQGRTCHSYPPRFHSTFFSQLSQILSDLQKLTFPCDKRFLFTYSTKRSSYLNDLRQYFPKLTHLELKMDFLGRKVFKHFKKHLDKIIRNHNSLFYTQYVNTNRHARGNYTLKIWL